jgi:hypothetical protein
MCLITLSFVACPVYHSSLHYLTNGTIFGKIYEYKVCVLIFSETFLILKTMQRGVYVRMSSCKVPVIFVRFSSNLAFLDRFSKNPHMSNFIKIRPVEAELFHADGQTDRRTGVTKLIVSSRKSAKSVATVLIGIFGYRMAVSLTRPFVFAGSVLCIYAMAANSIVRDSLKIDTYSAGQGIPCI